MSDVGIQSIGIYVPTRRLARSAMHGATRWYAPALSGLVKGTRATAGWDEDAITMAVEAGRTCLANRDRGGIGAVSLASTTLPFADRLNSGLAKEALNLPDKTFATDISGSQRAATSSLIDALNAGRTRLCLAADRRKARPASEGEMIHGDAAAAVLVGAGAGIARLIGHASETVDFVDHFRASDADFDYGWEARWIRDEGLLGVVAESIAGALERIGVAPATIDHAILPVCTPGAASALARRVGLRAEALADTLTATIGDSGAGHPLVMLSHVLARATPGHRIAVVGIGQGVDVIVFEATAALAEAGVAKMVAAQMMRGREDANYIRYLVHRGLLEIDKGMRAEVDHKQPGSTLFRHRKAVLGLVGGRCTRTGTVQFPRTDVSVSQNERAAGTQEDYPLADRTARIVTFTADNLSYSPDPPINYGTIDFEGGGRMMAEFVDCESSDLAVGSLVRMVFRIQAVDKQRNFTKYFWKAVPLDGGKD